MNKRTNDKKRFILCLLSGIILFNIIYFIEIYDKEADEFATIYKEELKKGSILKFNISTNCIEQSDKKDYIEYNTDLIKENIEEISIQQETQEKQTTENTEIVEIKKVDKKNIETKNNIDINNIDKNKFLVYDAIVSYYTYLPQETGSGDGITASGKKVSSTSLAIPRKDDILKFGTIVEFDKLSDGYMKDYNGKYLTRIADDTGNPKNIRKVDDFTYRVDVFCPRLENETDEQYHKRVYSYGKTTTKIKVYLD